MKLWNWRTIICDRRSRPKVIECNDNRVITSIYNDLRRGGVKGIGGWKGRSYHRLVNGLLKIYNFCNLKWSCICARHVTLLRQHQIKFRVKLLIYGTNSFDCSYLPVFYSITNKIYHQINLSLVLLSEILQ